MKLSIGDQVVYRPWGKEPIRTAEVLSIEICKEGEIHFLVELLTEAQLEEYMLFLKSNDYEKD